MIDVINDALLESLKVFLFVIIFHIILSFFEGKLSNFLTKQKKVSPLVGSGLGLIPQCGISVISADLYLKEHITLGTIIAVFISCSDEAIPHILSDPEKAIMVIPLLLIKFVIGFSVGFLIDIVYSKNKENVKKHHHNCHHEPVVYIGCCHHEIEGEKESKLKKHVIHPLIHSVKIFLYIFIITVLFGTIVYYVKEENIISFIESSKYFAPIYSSLIGLVPNCVSSVVISEMYLHDQLSFGSALAGLIANAGLGILVLIKNKKMIKKAIIIILILLTVALFSGYIINLIFGF